MMPGRLTPWIPGAALLVGLAACAAGQPVPVEPVGPEGPVGPVPAESADSGSAPDAVGKRHTVLPLPVIFYTPDTRWAGGAAGFHTYRASADDRPTVSAASFIYTQNRQVQAEYRTDAYLADGLYAASIELIHSKFPDSFYGIGNATLTEDQEAYTARSSRGQVEVRRRIGRGVYVGGSYELRSVAILDVEAGMRLGSGTVPGSDGGWLSGLGTSVAFDTRDNVLNPTRGSYHMASATRFGGAIGGDHDMARYTVALRQYVPIRDGQVLGVHGTVRSTSGDVPFTMLPQLGGQNIMRGTLGSRFRDHHMMAAQAEYRLQVWRRFGAAGFVGAGQVADRLDAIRIADLHPSLGFGLRFMLDTQERANLRVDFGYGRAGASGMYITVGEAF
jgi:outer membrane protein assembly factor BamA